MSDLSPLIHNFIAQQGPLSTAFYMALCLTHPRYGFYQRSDVAIGRCGHFITAPEISQVFGEMLGVWLASLWVQLKRPSRCHVVELGPGKGTMIQDVLRAVKHVDGLLESLRVLYVDTQERPHIPGVFCKSMADITQHIACGPVIFLGNEYLDCLPVHQKICKQGQWYTRCVGREKDKLQFVYGTPLAGVCPEQDGVVVEHAPQLHHDLSYMKEMMLCHTGGCCLCDYGYIQPPGRSTLQAVYRHRPCSVFYKPGEADMTALVDFRACQEFLQAPGIRVRCLEQTRFLKEHGWDQRVAMLKQTVSAQQQQEFMQGVRCILAIKNFFTLTAQVIP